MGSWVDEKKVVEGKAGKAGNIIRCCTLKINK